MRYHRRTRRDDARDALVHALDELVDGKPDTALVLAIIAAVHLHHEVPDEVFALRIRQVSEARKGGQ